MATISFRPYILSSILGAAALMSLTSCEDFLEVTPQDKPAIEVYYTNAERIRQNTMALYSAWEWKDYMMNFQWKFDMLAGDMFYTYGEEGQFYFGNFSNANSYLNEGWKGLYNVIGLANNIINDMPDAARENGVDESAITQGLAEARCIRGVCYYLLSQYWGDVPVITDGSGLVGENNFDVPRNTRKSVYRFAEADLDFAAKNLPASDDAFRANRYTALAYLAKLHVTMAAHTDCADRASLYASAVREADEVITANPDIKSIDYSTLFDKEANNGPESLLAIQCMVYGYGYGNPRNCAWSRQSLADQSWGNGKGPTISLQNLYDSHDLRARNVFMAEGFTYPGIERSKGGYTYEIYNEERGDEANEMLAHIKKYVLGHSSDVEGGIGGSQDAPNNIYLLRLADVYFTYAEAVMGTADATSDQTAIDRVNAVRARAGLAGYHAPMSWRQLIDERRREFAMESQNWFDVLRWWYRDPQGAVDYLNGMDRHEMYVFQGSNDTERNDRDKYILATSRAEGGQFDAGDITITNSSMVMPIPATVITAAPSLSGEAVEYAGE
ncbi:MAG: RagB/SusD family nutrient uptake outer membrane protein [Muribaculaceae bacterium]|nr:RagB/SusD family nutrient uptake outer membrane protein [Muribaculaceae bacterium]